MNYLVVMKLIEQVGKHHTQHFQSIESELHFQLNQFLKIQHYIYFHLVIKENLIDLYYYDFQRSNLDLIMCRYKKLMGQKH